MITFKKNLKISIILSVILLTSLYTNTTTNKSGFFSNSDKNSNNENFITDKDFKEDPDVSFVGQDDWWNQSFSYRRLINITNPYDVNLEDYAVNITFSYTDLVADFKMNSSLKDVRIVKGNQLVKYYVKKDCPTTDQATVWFDADISAKTISSDYYMYYGNYSVDFAHSYYMNDKSESFGWIKNGNFELNVTTGTKVNSYFGWDWSTDPPNNIPGTTASYDDATDTIAQHNITSIKLNQSRVYEGKYSYKWGWSGNYINNSYVYIAPSWYWKNTESYYRGTLYSNRFIVPTVTAGDSEDAKIYIQVYRNIRTHSFETSDAYFLRLCTGSTYGSNPNLHGTLMWGEVWGNNYQTYYQPTTGTYRVRYYNGIRDLIGTGGSVNTKHKSYTSPDKDLNQDGSLTGVIYIDVTDYQGQEIFLETGMSGNEDITSDAAFGQIDDVRFNYTLNTALNEEQTIFTKLTIITKDAYGELIPNAEVSLFNGTEKKFTLNTSITGDLTYSQLPFGIYNISVNYTLPSGNEIVVLNKTLVNYNTIQNTTILTLHMWTIYFEVKDWDNNPLNYGIINISESVLSPTLDTLRLDDDGKAIFRWKNGTIYYYKLYYDNIDYFKRYTLLNASTIIGKDNTIKVNITKLEIEIFDKDGIPLSGVLVRVFNKTDGALIANFSTISGSARGLINTNIGLWYLCNTTYNFTLQFFGFDKLFNVTKSDQWKKGDYVASYNYTLNHSYTLEFRINLNASDFLSEFRNKSADSQTVIWGQELYFQLNYTISNDGGNIWSPIENPNYVRYEIREFGGIEIIKLGDMDLNGNGVYNLTLNSSELIGNKNYILTVKGHKNGYIDPEAENFYITINGLPTELTIHDYYNNLVVVSEISQAYDELVNITVKYSSLGVNITGATLSYDWGEGTGVINSDPLHNGYYTFTIDTGDALTIGTKIIEITAYYGNYSIISRAFNLHITPRVTSINNEINPLDKIYNRFVRDSYNFTFEYKDHERTITLGDLQEAYYKWYRLSSEGAILEGPSEFISLIALPANIYVLDFNTETRAIGTYLLRITMSKTNYETQKLDVTLNILERTFEADLSAKGLEDDQLNIVHGKKVTITVELTDNSITNAPLTGAKVILEIDDEEFEFDEVEPGVYELKFDTKDYEAFFASNTITGDIIITKTDYETETLDITIVIEMEEIMPGIPTFYFVIFIATICAITGSLITYRYIQVARIPKFVKKVKKIKKAIKSGDKISESLLYPTKESFVIKKLEDKFKILGLSYKKIMKISDEKEIQESKKSIKSSRGEL